MRKWIVDHSKDGTRFGIHIEAISSQDALFKAIQMGLSDIEVMGKLSMIVPIKGDGFTPDWRNKIDYDIIYLN